MTQGEFSDLMASITGAIAGRALDPALEAELNRQFPPDGETFRAVADASAPASLPAGCATGTGRHQVRPRRETRCRNARLPVDNDMDNVAGGHRHLTGEIDLIMPTAGTATFDGRGAGWLVYEPGSAHVPTVAGGRALVLYLLPQGAIEFTKT
jgi:hypothetical protein